MIVEVNGRRTELPDAATLADAVAAVGAGEEHLGLAAAVDGDVVPRGEWSDRKLAEGEEIEVVRAVQGG
jgi:sulfur carrier protein